MRSLPIWLLLAILSAVPCACNRADDSAPDRTPPANNLADDGDILEPVYLPGGVTDDQGKVGYLVNPKGGIDAVDLASGKLLWHTDTASYPLIVHKDSLVAQDSHDADPIRIVTLDLSNKGKRLRTSDPIQLAPTAKELDEFRKTDLATPPADPDDKRGGKAERPKVKTFCRGRIQRGELHLIWSPSFSMARVDLATGKVTRQPKTPSYRRTPLIKDYAEVAKIAADPKAFGVPQKLPELAKLEDPLPGDLFRLAADPRDKGGPSMHLDRRWVAGDLLAVLVRGVERRSSTTTLVLWDVRTGKNVHSSVVLRNEHYKGARDNDGRVIPVLHGRYLMHHYTRSGFPDGPPTRGVKMFSLESRKWSPTIRLELEASYLSPAGSWLFYVIPKSTYVEGTLKAVDLALDRNGPAHEDAKVRVLWERPVLLPMYAPPNWDEAREP